MELQKADKELIRAWVDSGEPRMKTIVRVAAEYGLSHAEAVALVRQTLQEVVELVGGINRAEFMTQQLSRLEALAATAQEKGELSVALNAYKEIHQLVGLHAVRRIG